MAWAVPSARANDFESKESMLGCWYGFFRGSRTTVLLGVLCLFIMALLALQITAYHHLLMYR